MLCLLALVSVTWMPIPGTMIRSAPLATRTIMKVVEEEEERVKPNIAIGSVVSRPL